MPQTMTMSGQIVTSAPLDLTTTTRDRGSSSERTSGGKGHPRDNVEVNVESPAQQRKCSNGKHSSSPELRDHPGGYSLTSPIQTSIGNEGLNMAASHGSIILSPLKYETVVEDSNSKLLDTSASRLPFRKRPFLGGQETAGSSRTPPIRENIPLNEKNHELKCGPSPIKVLKRNHHNDTGHLEPQRPRTPKNPLRSTDCQQSSDAIQHLQAFHHCSFPGYALYPWQRMLVNVPVLNVPPPLRQVEETDRLLADVALATRQDEDGDTALHIAVVQGQEALVDRLIQILVQAHKDLDIYNNLRQTPLHLAVITHQAGLVQALLCAGADPGALDRNGQTALHLCCEHGQEVCLSLILSHSSRSPSPCLESRNYEGLTPLHLAVLNGDTNLAKKLLDSGADINAVDIKSGRSPLVHAVENNCMEMVNFLIENGCDVNSQSYSGNTALHSACGRGQVEAVRALLRNGADSSLKNYHNDTAVMVAKNKKVTDVLRGKGSRSQNAKTQENQRETISPQSTIPHSRQPSINGSPSPNSLSCSPLATPTPMAPPPQRSTSHSPMAPPTHSPLSQSGESLSGHQSPMETQEKQALQLKVAFHNIVVDNRAAQRIPLPPHLFLSGGYKPHMSSTPNGHIGALMHSHPFCYPPGLQRPGLIFIPANLPPPITLCPPAQIVTGQSRPSSRSSDQSDMSTMSVSSEGKGES